MRIIGRSEKRVTAAVPVRLASLDNPGPAETAVTENLSSRGARVVTQRPWQPNEHLLIVSLSGSTHQLRARVVYCQPRRDAKYGIGLEFLEPSGGSGRNAAEKRRAGERSDPA